jgi:hypothetical protein
VRGSDTVLRARLGHGFACTGSDTRIRCRMSRK